LGIAPQQLLDLDKTMLDALVQGLKDEAKEVSDASKRQGRSRS
jgi:hypothetical protein